MRQISISKTVLHDNDHIVIQIYIHIFVVFLKFTSYFTITALDKEYSSSLRTEQIIIFDLKTKNYQKQINVYCQLKKRRSVII